MLKLDRGSLSAVECAAKEKMRYALNGVYVTKDECVATDGRKLVRVKHPPQDPEESKDLADLKPCILQGDALPGLVKMLPKRVLKDEDRMVYLDVAKTNENGSAHFGVLAPSSRERMDFPIPKVEGNFPNYDEVTPTGEPVVTVILSAEYIAQIAKVIKAVNSERGYKYDNGPDALVFKFFEGHLNKCGQPAESCGPIRIESRDGAVVGVLMPISPR